MAAPAAAANLLTAGRLFCNAFKHAGVRDVFLRHASAILVGSPLCRLSSQFSRVPQMAVNGAQIFDLSKLTVRFAIQWYNMAIRPSTFEVPSKTANIVVHYFGVAPSSCLLSVKIICSGRREYPSSWELKNRFGSLIIKLRPTRCLKKRDKSLNGNRSPP